MNGVIGVVVSVTLFATCGAALLVFVVKKAIDWMLESAGESDA